MNPRMATTATAILLLLACLGPVQLLKDIPVIGIISKPLENETHTIKTNMTQIINMPYVNYIMSCGAKPVQISHKASEQELRTLLYKINGVYITGGGTDFVYFDKATQKYYWTPFAKAAKIILKIAMEMNDKGIYFPIWGTCMGFQALAFLVSEDPVIPKYGCDCSNYNAKLMFTADGKKSRMFSPFSPSQMNDFATKGLTYNSHNYYVDYLDFVRNRNLRNFFNILAYSDSKDKKLTFITAIEAKSYPFYGTQFHPEVRPYHRENRIPGPENVAMAQTFGNFFVNETRKNTNSMSYEEESKLSILNTPMSWDPQTSFIYLFP